MKTISPALQAIFDAGPFVQCDIYTITLAVGGTAIYLTTADVDILYGGHTFTSKGPFIDSGGKVSGVSKATMHQKVGLDVDTWQVAVMPRPVDPLTGATFPDKIGGQPWIAACKAGALDDAVVNIDRAYWTAWPGTPPPLVPGAVLATIFYGRVAAVDPRRNFVVLNINSHIEQLTRTLMPRNLYQSSCIHTLFDTGCTLAAGTFAKAGTISSVTTQSRFVSAITAPSGSATYTLGRVVFTSGLNAGFARMVKRWSASTFDLIAPLPYALQVGDGFTAYPGCDKQQGTCGLFANSANFGGTPNIPPPERAI